MTLAADIIARRMPDFDAYLAQGETLDDIDEYGFTPLIEAVITRQPDIAEALLKRQAKIDRQDISGRTPLHWAVDLDQVHFSEMLLKAGAKPNTPTRAGMPPMVYPVLRNQASLRRLLIHHGAKLDFALDFILGKLLGHRFELTGTVDIVNAEDNFIELNYEGFILEFTVDLIQDSLRRFTGSFSARHLRPLHGLIKKMILGFEWAKQVMQLQHQPQLGSEDWLYLQKLAKAPLLVLPAASRGHAMGFARLGSWWAKVDRGENAEREGSINLYQIGNPKRFNAEFLHEFMLRKQARSFFHHEINQLLDLKPRFQIPMSGQITGNCSWANIQALVPVLYSLLQMEEGLPFAAEPALNFYQEWISWDQDRAIEEAVQRFKSASPVRKASIASMLAAVLFQSCNAGNPAHLLRAEKILPILTNPDYDYILKSYLEVYCIQRLTPKGNNLLKILDDCNVNPNIGVTAIATGLKERK